MFAGASEWVEIDVRINDCRDPSDNKFLELAVSGRATHIITGDGDLLGLDPFQGKPVLTPGEFLRQIGRGSR